MGAPSVDIKDILESDSSLALEFQTDLFIGREPSSPDNTVTITDTSGFGPDLYYNDAKYYYPSVQIQVRNNSYITGWDLINDIKELLHGRGHETWNGSRYELIRCTTEPLLFNYDEHNRVRFIINISMQRKPA
jgi:hypothetical protein